MIKNTFTNNRAFSLLELTLVVSIMTVVLSAAVPSWKREYLVKAAQKTALDMSTIEDAARAYYIDNKLWPAALLDLQNGGYLPPTWDGKNPWKNLYTISSVPSLFTVTTTVQDGIQGVLSSSLPTATVTGTSVSSSVSTPDKSLNSSIPSGVIAAWSGTVASIPSGWALCDGTNGTPDLRDKFIVGARQDLAGKAVSNIMGSLLQTGGSTTHNHGGQTGSHQLTIAEMPSHHFDVMINDATTSGGTRYPETVGVSSLKPYSTNTLGGDQGHTHTTTADSHVPPYYALAFIMKL